MTYRFKTRIAHSANYGGQRLPGQIRYLIYHFTSNDGDTDEGNAAYFANNIVKASAHYFADDDSVTQSVPDLRIAYAVGGNLYTDVARTGGGKMYGKITNTNSISIEMCDTVRNGVVLATEATLANALAIGRVLMERYNIPLSNVYRHFDVTGKHCPRYFMDDAKWEAFKARLGEDEMTDEQFYKMFCEAMARFMSVSGTGDNPSGSMAQAAKWAQNNGIFNGDGKGNYGWQKPISREAVAQVLCNMSKNGK